MQNMISLYLHRKLNQVDQNEWIHWFNSKIISTLETLSYKITLQGTQLHVPIMNSFSQYSKLQLLLLTMSCQFF